MLQRVTSRFFPAIIESNSNGLQYPLIPQQAIEIFEAEEHKFEAEEHKFEAEEHKQVPESKPQPEPADYTNPFRAYWTKEISYIILEFFDEKDLLALGKSPDDAVNILEQQLPRLNKENLHKVIEERSIKPTLTLVNNHLQQGCTLEELHYPRRAQRKKMTWLILTLCSISAGTFGVFGLNDRYQEITAENTMRLWTSNVEYAAMQKNCTDTFRWTFNCRVIPHKSSSVSKTYNCIDYPSCESFDNEFINCGKFNILDEQYIGDVTKSNGTVLGHRRCALSIYRQLPNCAPARFKIYKNACRDYTESKPHLFLAFAIIVGVVTAIHPFIVLCCYRSRRKKALLQSPVSVLAPPVGSSAEWLLKCAVITEQNPQNDRKMTLAELKALLLKRIEIRNNTATVPMRFFELITGRTPVVVVEELLPEETEQQNAGHLSQG